MKNVKTKDELLDVSFNTMLIFKSLFALGETLAGLVLIFIPLDLIKAAIHHVAVVLPLTSLSVLVTEAGQRLTSDATLFAIVYLLLHGVLKLGTLALLWKKSYGPILYRWLYWSVSLFINSLNFHKEARCQCWCCVGSMCL